MGIRTRLDCRARPARRAHPGLRAHLGRQARLDRRTRLGRRTHLEHWANDLDELDRAILTNLTAQSCNMGHQASRSSGHPACLGFPIDPARVGRRV